MARMLWIFVLAACLVGCRSGQLELNQKTVVCGPYVKVETELLSQRGNQ